MDPCMISKRLINDVKGEKNAAFVPPAFGQPLPSFSLIKISVTFNSLCMNYFTTDHCTLRLCFTDDYKPIERKSWQNKLNAVVLTAVV